MPKDTFINLPSDKRQMIIEAIQAVFLDKPIGKISVADIVQQANIPRGSFYMYFDDLEDMFGFLLDYSMKAFEEEELSRLRSKKTPFFKYMEKAFLKDIMFFKTFQHQKIVTKFLSNHHSYNVDYEGYLRRRHTHFTKFFSMIDREELVGLDVERIMHLYYFLTQFKMQMIQSVFKGRLNKSTANDEYLWMIHIIRTGLEVDQKAR